MNQFRICRFKNFRRGSNQFGGGLMLYINENITCILLSDHPICSELELMANVSGFF